MENGSLNYSDRFCILRMNILGSQEIVACTFRWWTWINFPVPISLSLSKLIQHISRKSWILACTSRKNFLYMHSRRGEGETFHLAKILLQLHRLSWVAIVGLVPSCQSQRRRIFAQAKHLRRFMISVRVFEVFLLLLINRLSSESKFKWSLTHRIKKFKCWKHLIYFSTFNTLQDENIRIFLFTKADFHSRVKLISKAPFTWSTLGGELEHFNEFSGIISSSFRFKLD